MNGATGNLRSRYWMAAPTIRWGGDPLLAGRSVALFVSLLGFFGFYLFARELYGEREGVVAAALYVLCPAVLFHNNQFVAETFLFSTAPFVYWSLLKAMQPGKARWLWTIAAVVIATALLLFKQSGTLLLTVSFVLPCMRLRRANETDQPTDWGVSDNWKEFARNFLLVAAVVVAAQLAANALIPSQFDAAKVQFNGRWVMSPRELLELPIQVWSANLRLVGDYIGSYYSWLAPVFVGVFLWFGFRRKSLPDLALASMCLAGGIGVTFLLRGFNEYLFNTAVIVVLLPLLARTGVFIWRRAGTGPGRLLRGGLLSLAAIILAYWSYQIVLMRVSPGRYLEESTPWGTTTYLKGWPTGFGVQEVIAMLEKEKRPGIIFADTQWGNPRTGLEVYRDRFPNLRIVPISREFLDPAETRKLRDLAQRLGPAHFAIFSADPSGSRQEWEDNVEREMCAERTEVKAYPGQMPIIVCRF